ncbi:PE-PGRS family protein [Streptomyces sp. CA-249302]|uniref:PE-PGRS family protein n=1 Tax=Streptomyces sp. CA-249302 TaxID=3240058 RepID=UPI003D9428B6
MVWGRRGYAELFGRAGLEVVGEWRFEYVLAPGSAWLAAAAEEPQVTVDCEAGGGLSREAVGEVNAAWRRLADEAGFFAGDGVFLIDVPGDWTWPGRLWTRVRLGGEWDLAGVLGTDFVTVSADGDALVGAEAVAGTVRVVAAHRILERREQAALAAARETAEERAEVWAALLRGAGVGEALDRPLSERPEPGASLAKDWADGLVGNPATPDDVRFGLLGRSPRLFYNPLPPEVLESAIAHPEWHVRSMVAEFQPLTPEQWARLILGGEDERRRWGLTMVAGDRRDEITEDACRTLATDPSARIRAAAAVLRGLPADLAVELTADPEPRVRTAACPVAWPHLDPARRQALLEDGARDVRLAALREHHKEHPLSLKTYTAEGLGTGPLGIQPLERELAEHVVRHGDVHERRSLGGNPCLPADLVALLAEDPEPGVRWAVSVRADLTEEQRAAIPVDFDPGGRYHELGWVAALHRDPEAMRRLAASSHPLVRRSVARARHLPPDVVERLARDEDRIVHLFLAESCDDAPADMLLGVWRWWTGSLTVPDRPRGHPNFPRVGLLRYADDLDPRMRQLALDDPESTPELVERMSRDPDTEVRYRAAKDPRLTVASAVRLVGDPVGHIRSAAARHPDLPAQVLAGLLFDPGLAREAAEHPALPEEVLRWMAEQLR